MDTYKRQAKFYYYRVVEEKRNQNDAWEVVGDYNLVDWLRKITPSQHHNVNLSDCIVNFDDIHKFQQDDEPFPIYVGRLFKLRETNMPSKVKDGESAMPIPLDDDEYIGEDVLFLYDRGKGHFMLQRNRMSVGISKITEWVNKEIDDQDNRRVVFQPIGDRFSMKDLAGKSARSFEIALGNLYVDNDSSPLSDIIRSISRYNGYTARISVSVGRSKHAELDPMQTTELVHDVQENIGCVSSAKLKLRDDEKAQVETVDIVDNLLHDCIEFEIPVKQPIRFESAKYIVYDRYLERREKVEECAGKTGS